MVSLVVHCFSGECNHTHVRTVTDLTTMHMDAHLSTAYLNSIAYLFNCALELNCVLIQSRIRIIANLVNRKLGHNHELGRNCELDQ